MMENPCLECPRKGCGAYHDVCVDYNERKSQEAQKREQIKAWRKRDARDYIRSSTYKSRTHGAFKNTMK